MYLRLSKYLSPSYFNKNKTKRAICSAIFKYGSKNFTFYFLEYFDQNSVSPNFLFERENYWFQNIKPSYNIQSIINPFSGSNHYRFGTKLSQEIKSKISNTLKGRLVSETKKVNHILGANKKSVFCFDWVSGIFFMVLEGRRFLRRALNISYNRSYT